MTYDLDKELTTIEYRPGIRLPWDLLEHGDCFRVRGMPDELVRQYAYNKGKEFGCYFSVERRESDFTHLVICWPGKSYARAKARSWNWPTDIDQYRDIIKDKRNIYSAALSHYKRTGHKMKI